MFDDLFQAICHRDPTRSFPGPDGGILLCARCTGLYAGALAGLAAAAAVLLLRRRPAGRTAFLALAAMTAATPLEALGEAAGLWEGTRFLRLALGALGGAAVAYAMMSPGTGAARTSRPLPAWHLAVLPALAAALAFGALRGPDRIAAPMLAAGWLGLLASVVAVLFRQWRRRTAGSGLEDQAP